MYSITDGLVHHEAGRLGEAESIYRKILSTDPNNCEALHWLGVIAHQMGDNHSAKDLIEKALGLDRSNAKFFNHLGMVLKELKELEAALDSFNKCIAITPNNAETYNNMGNVYLLQCKFNEALLCYQKALTIKPNMIEAVKNIGDLYKKQCKLKEAASQYHKAINIDPNCFSAYDAALTLGVLDFLKHDLPSSKRYLEMAKSMQGGITKATRTSKTYWNYISFLIAWWEKNESNHINTSGCISPKVLYVIGESHSLSVQNLDITIDEDQYVPNVLWIEGVKQWHLSKDKKNIYKYQFLKNFRKLPKKSTILITVGEIDCRIDEGIFPLWQKKGGDITNIIQLTISNFLNFVKKISAKREMEIIICGVPASNILRTNIDSKVLDLYGNFLCHFNSLLKASALSVGFCFVDVFLLTNIKNGYADGALHLDSNHLKPSSMKIAIKEFFNKPFNPYSSEHGLDTLGAGGVPAYGG